MRNIMLLCLIIMSTALCGCSMVSQEEYNDLDLYNKKLEKTISNLEADVKVLNEKNKELEKNNNELFEKLYNYENGAENQIIQIRSLFEEKEYQKVIDLAQKLHDSFNGTAEDIEGQELSSKSQKELEIIESEKQAETERIAAEAKKSAQDKAREIIRISKVDFEKGDIGNIDVYINFINNSDKTIKYVSFTVTPYNAVGDKVYGEYETESRKRLKATGPYKEGEGIYNNWHWPSTWFISTVAEVRLEKVEIDYMDGSSVTLQGDEIDYVRY